MDMTGCNFRWLVDLVVYLALAAQLVAPCSAAPLQPDCPCPTACLAAARSSFQSACRLMPHLPVLTGVLDFHAVGVDKDGATCQGRPDTQALCATGFTPCPAHRTPPILPAHLLVSTQPLPIYNLPQCSCLCVSHDDLTGLLTACSKHCLCTNACTSGCYL